MGAFAEKVRLGIIKGPASKVFKRDYWESAFSDRSLDDDDRRILIAGLFFDSLLTFLRSAVKTADIALSPRIKAQLAVALATFDYQRMVHQTRIVVGKKDVQPTVAITQIQQKKVTTSSGQQFSPDELISGTGDGLKYLLRDCLSQQENSSIKNASKIDPEHVVALRTEINKAIIYHCAVEWWNDCVGNGYQLERRSEGVAIAPSNVTREIARTASTYRRLSLALQEQGAFHELWIHRATRKQKDFLAGIPLVEKICITNQTVTNVELGRSAKALDSAMSGVVARIFVQKSYYEELLKEPLPAFRGFSLEQIIYGWQLLHSFSRKLFDGMEPVEEASKVISLAPKIPERILVGMFSKALSISKDKARSLLDIFVFKGTREQEVWAQPLVPIDVDNTYCLLIPAIHSIHLLRVVEVWMRQGHIELSKKGKKFESFCRVMLADSLQRSPIKGHVTFIKQSVKFKLSVDKEEEIDLVLILGDTVLVVEVKCILWPDDSLQFSNYCRTVEDAVDQISRKRQAVEKNYEAFSERLNQLGYTAPTIPKILGCVLTNSAVYAGFPINGVPICDLAILGKFFENEHVVVESRQKAEIVDSRAISFYSCLADAETILFDYLSDPPQLKNIKNSVKQRLLEFPIVSSNLRKIFHETFQVEIDVSAKLKEYGINDELISI